MPSPCRDCGESIDFEQAGNKWLIFNADTRERHRCQLDQTCTNCHKLFKGANWMTECPTCYRAGQTPKADPKPEPARRQVDSFDDEDPF